MPFIIFVTIASLLIGVLYIISVITTYRSHKATIEMRDIMREMNERDKARSEYSEHNEAQATGHANRSASEVKVDRQQD